MVHLCAGVVVANLNVGGVVSKTQCGVRCNTTREPVYAFDAESIALLAPRWAGKPY